MPRNRWMCVELLTGPSACLQVRFPTAVQDIALVPGGQQQQQQLVVGLRATNYLRLLDCTSLQVRILWRCDPLSSP
jgi:hypothetical protein